MTEAIEGRPSVLKGDFGGNFSDADSGYDDPGVITIPVVRTVFLNDSSGRKTSTTSTEWISVPRKNDETSVKARSTSTGSLESPGSRLSKDSGTGSSDALNQSTLSSESEHTFGPNFPMTSQDLDAFDISHFLKEFKKENENERRLRFLSTPREKRGQARPTIRDICTSHNISMTEESTKRVPRRRIRSKSADSRRPKGPQGLYSPTYSKILSPETMRNRKMWANVVRKDCILEQEYYKVPYEECNREIILGRSCSSETLLNNFKRLKRPSLCNNNSGDNFNINYDSLEGNERLDSGHMKCGNNRNPNNKGSYSTNDSDTTLNGKFAPNLKSPNTRMSENVNTQNTTTDQIQQLINDLNLIAYPEQKGKERGPNANLLDKEQTFFTTSLENNGLMFPPDIYYDTQHCTDNSNCATGCCLIIENPGEATVGLCQSLGQFGQFCAPGDRSHASGESRVFTYSCPCQPGLECKALWIRQVHGMTVMQDPKCTPGEMSPDSPLISKFAYNMFPHVPVE